MDQGPGEHDTHLMDGDEPDTVSCFCCGKQIYSYGSACKHCGARFKGEAWQCELEGSASGLSKIYQLGGAALLLVFIWLVLR